MNMFKLIIVLACGISWMIGHHLKWDGETTGYIGWAFWLCLLFM